MGIFNIWREYWDDSVKDTRQKAHFYLIDY